MSPLLSSSRRLLPITLALLAALSVLGACTGSAPKGTEGGGRGVLLIAIDALRADHVGSYGYDRDTTPALDALADEAVRFTNVWSASSRDLPAHCALLTGCDPNMMRRYYQAEGDAPEGSRFLVPRLMPHAAVSFLGAGFRTAAFLDSEHLTPTTGFDAGFQRIAPVGGELPGFGDAGPDVGAEGVTKRFLDWVNDVERGEDWFAYLQVSDLERVWTHRDPAWDGYFRARPGMDDVPPVSNDPQAFFAQPRSRWLGGAVSLGTYEARYDGRLRSLDQRLGALFEALRRSGRLENTTVCIVGSYGLQFGEAGLILDHGLYSRADLHVPWILKPAASAGGGDQELWPGRAAGALASTLDVAPTLLALAGVDQPPGMLGVSQVPNLTADVAVREYAFASSGYQEGGAAIALDCVLAMTYPTRSLGSSASDLTRGWHGREDAPPEQLMQVYDPATGAPAAVSAERYAELQAAALGWYGNTQDARSALFGSVWRGDALPPERVDELVELGFLARRP